VTAAQPFALVALALAIPIFAAYLHRKRRLSKKVPSVILMRAIAGVAKPTRRAWSKPRHIVSLALVMAALAGLAVALADLHAADDKPRDFVVVLDISASMGAGDPMRLQQAIGAVERSIGSLHPGDRVALVTTGAQTLVRVGLTEDHERVLALAKGAVPGGGSQSAAGAIALADRICKGGREGSIVLVSDLVGVQVPSTECPIEHIAIDRGGTNAGITALAVREADALGLSEVQVGLSSVLGRTQEVQLTFKVDGAVVDVLSLDLPPDGDLEKLHRLPLPPGERVSAEITHLPDDALALDDVASVARHGGGRVSVLLVAQTRLSFTAEALRLHPRVDLRVIGPRDSIGPDERFDLIVLEADYQAGSLPIAPKLVAFGVPPTKLGVLARGEIATPDILRWSFDHPLFRFVDLQGLDVPKAIALTPSSEQTSLIDAEEGSLALTGRFDGRDMVYVGFAPHQSDLVLRVGFVNLVANLVEWAAPPPPASDEGREGVLSRAETRLEGPPRLESSQPARFTAGSLASAPPWTWLAIAALAALALEWMLPAFAAAVKRLTARRGTKEAA
jgi:hypothetical protein